MASLQLTLGIKSSGPISPRRDAPSGVFDAYHEMKERALFALFHKCSTYSYYYKGIP
jgi:hypothetical protein